MLPEPPPSAAHIASHSVVMETINVAIRNVSGECLEMDVEPQTKICDLKKIIAESWHIPEIFQRLVSGTVILQDQGRIAACYVP